ncbi:MAG: TolB family protein, partial [Chitinophagaceae bacterium]
AWIAFTSNRDGKSNLYVIAIAGGESEKLTDVKTGVGDFEWRPDGKAIAYIVNDSLTQGEEKAKKTKNDWYYVDEDYKQNRLFVLWLNEKDSAGKKVQKKLITENYNVNAFSWSPDGKTIVFSHGKSPLVGHNVYSDISMVDVATAKAKQLIKTKASETRPLYSPDGKYIAYEISDEAVTWGGAS